MSDACVHDAGFFPDGRTDGRTSRFQELDDGLYNQVNVNVNVLKLVGVQRKATVITSCENPLEYFDSVNMDLMDLKYETWITAKKHYMRGWIATGICCFARTIRGAVMFTDM